VVIWVANKGRATHSCRVRVSNIRDSFALGDYFALTLDGELAGGDVKLSVPEMSRIREWVLLNRDVLLDCWLEKTSTEGMMARIRKLA
jgi:hypothetical protein